MGILQLGARPGGEDQRANFLQRLIRGAPKRSKFTTERIFLIVIALILILFYINLIVETIL